MHKEDGLRWVGEVGDGRLKKKMERRELLVWAAVDGREKRIRGIKIGLGFRSN